MRAEPDNVAAALALEAVEQGRCAANASGEGAWSHCSGDRGVAAVVGEEKQPVAKFDARHILAKIDRTFHAPASRFQAEQADSKPLSKVRVNLSDKLTTHPASFARRAA